MIIIYSLLADVHNKTKKQILLAALNFSQLKVGNNKEGPKGTINVISDVDGLGIFLINLVFTSWR